MAENKSSPPEQLANPEQVENPQPVQPEQPAQAEQPEQPAQPAPEAQDDPAAPTEQPTEQQLLAVVNEVGQLQTKNLEEVLATYWRKESVKIVDSKVEPATTKGTNFTSDVWRVSFSYTVNEETEVKKDTVVVKSRPNCPETNKLMHTTTAFTNEIFAYEHVIPTLSNIIGVPFRVPKFMHGNEYSIVLEDMQHKGFKSTNKKLAVEWNQVWSTITEVAKLHAASIVMKKLLPDKFDALVNSIIKIPVGETLPLGERQNNSLDTILKVLEDTKVPEITKQKDVLENMRKDAWVQQNNIIEEEVSIRVINHGSVWINNLLYRKDMVTLLDWQHLVFSSPAHDLSFFLYVNMDSDFLTNKKQKLIDYYLVNLHQFIYDATVNKLSVEDISAILEPLNNDWINKELKRYSLYAYMMAQWITPVFYWSEAVFQTVSKQGGIENMSMEDRMKHMTSDQRDRMIKLTKLYFTESK